MKIPGRRPLFSISRTTSLSGSMTSPRFTRIRNPRASGEKEKAYYSL
jgi:hypothetical protein